MTAPKRLSRKSLIDCRPICGIYRITNRHTGRSYIGQSVDIITRWQEHVKGLLRGSASNESFYNDFVLYGLQGFTAEIIKECPRDELSSNEKLYIREYHNLGGVYNVNVDNTNLIKDNNLMEDKLLANLNKSNSRMEDKFLFRSRKKLWRVCRKRKGKNSPYKK